MKPTPTNLRPSLLTHPDLVHLAYGDEFEAFQTARLEELAPRNVLAKITAGEMVREHWRRLRLWGAMTHLLETASGEEAFAPTFALNMDALHQAESRSSRRYLLCRQDFASDQQRPVRVARKE